MNPTWPKKLCCTCKCACKQTISRMEGKPLQWHGCAEGHAAATVLVAISGKAWAYPKSHMSAPKKAEGAGGNCGLSKGATCRPQVLKTPKYHFLFGLTCINQDSILGASGCFPRCCRQDFGTVSAIACKVSKARGMTDGRQHPRLFAKAKGRTLPIEEVLWPRSFSSQYFL